MKNLSRLFSLIIILIFVLNISACSKQDSSKSNNVTQEIVESSNSTSQDASASAGSYQDLWDFEVEDLDGNKDNLKSFFAQHDFTLVNIWATFCGPCKVELPALQKISEDFSEHNIVVVGMATDVYSDRPDTIDLAKNIFKESNVDFISFVSNNSLQSTLFKAVYGVPTTIIINENGEIVGDAFVGAQTYDTFAKALQAVLDGE